MTAGQAPGADPELAVPPPTEPPASEAPESEAPESEAPAVEALPADPDAYDSPRATQARARGLSAPYIAGGEDPDPDAGQREERRYLRLLIAMVVTLILSGFVLGFLANLLGFPGLVGNP